MSELVLTFCDRCSPGARIGDKIRNGIGRGWAEWTEEHCVTELGWQRTPEGVICPECQEEVRLERVCGS